MPQYTYTAVNSSGKQVKNRMEASSLEAAKGSLRSAGYMVLDIKEQVGLNKDLELPFLGFPKAKDMAMFCRQFASILRAGVPVATVLSMLGQQTENSKLRAAVCGMGVDLEKGVTLAESMRKYPKVFKPMLVNMVSAGERSDNLETSFDQMEAYYDKANKTRNAVRGAMTYPIILGVVMVIVLIVMMVKIIPMFLTTFDSMDMELPAVTKAVVAVSDWFVSWWWLFILILAGMIAGIFAFRRTASGRHFFGLLSRKLPVVKELTVRSNCATFCRTMSLLQASGIDMLDSLGMTADNMANIWYAEAVADVRRLVTRGVPLAEAMRSTGLFPPMICNMVGIGEESGDIVSMLDKTADYYEDETTQATARVLALLQPAMILFMAGFVVVIVLAIFLPMLNMTQAYDQYL